MNPRPRASSALSRASRAALLAALAVLAPGCLYAHFQTPMDRDLDQTRLGSKVGRASWRGYLWLCAVGDAGTQAAAQDGGITVIHHADEEVFSVLFGLYFRRTTIVYGD